MLKLIRNLVLILASAATGVYVLWKLHSVWGALGIALSLAVALPTELKAGISVLKDDASDLQPVIDALKKQP